jgi:hypothetical protein
VVTLNAFRHWAAENGRHQAAACRGRALSHAEELQFIVQESEDGGLLRGESGQLLRDLFEFGDRTPVKPWCRACCSSGFQ